MCGIISAISAERDISHVLLEGLAVLEYRGYDSAGLAICDDDGKPRRVRAQGKVVELEKRYRAERCTGLTGIAHTRWATHGAPSEANAHPHRVGDMLLVCNGILENHLQLRQELSASGVVFESETDTETMTALIHQCVGEAGNLRAGLRRALGRMQGSWAFVLMPAGGGQLIGVTSGCPLVLGIGDGEAFLASDIIALARLTEQVVFLQDGDIAFVRADGFEIESVSGKTVKRKVERRVIPVSQSDKGNYRHFTEKEIAEQPAVVRETLSGRLNRAGTRIIADSLGVPSERLARVEQVHLAACGSAYYAASIGALWLEQLAGVPTTAYLASEYRSQRVIVPDNTLFVAVSQSGETADTLAALRAAEQRGYSELLAVCNVADSLIVRTAPATLLTRAGREIGVLSTKAVMAQLVSLLLLALEIGNRRQKPEELSTQKKLGAALWQLPELLDEVLLLDGEIEAKAHLFTGCAHALFLGRGQQVCIAAEGALKMKESAYIHAEAYAAGELKHGPLALVDEQMPVVALMPRQREAAAKMMGNLQEVAARGGQLLVLEAAGGGESGISAGEALGCEHILLPAAEPEIGLMLELVAVQLLAYHVARLCGTDVDQPRNLAKSVTVE